MESIDATTGVGRGSPDGFLIGPAILGYVFIKDRINVQC